MNRPNRHRLLLSPLWFLVALVGLIASVTVSGNAAHGTETRVRAFDTPTAINVGPAATESPGDVGRLRPETGAIVVATGVATNTVDDAVSITKPYSRPSGATTPAQRASVQGQPCVDCGTISPVQVADHKVPLVQEYYTTGTIDATRMRALDAVQPQCVTCSAQQGAAMAQYSKLMKKLFGLE